MKVKITFCLCRRQRGPFANCTKGKGADYGLQIAVQAGAGLRKGAQAVRMRGNMARRWNWLRLLTYCLSRVLAVSLVIAVVLVGGALAFAHGQAVKVPKRNNIRQSGLTFRPISGVITDSECGARHNQDGKMSATECARFCARNGSRYVLVDGEKRYALTGNTEELSKLAGQRVTISGSLTGDTIHVSSAFVQ